MAFNIKTGERVGPGFSRKPKPWESDLEQYREVLEEHMDYQLNHNMDDFRKRCAEPVMRVIRELLAAETPLRKDVADRLDSIIARDDWGILFSSASDQELMHRQMAAVSDDLEAWLPYARMMEGVFDAFISMDSPVKDSRSEELIAMAREFSSVFAKREAELREAQSPQKPR